MVSYGFPFSIGAGGASCGQRLLAFDLLGVFDRFNFPTPTTLTT
jgi:hypothetical protein